VHDSQSTPGVSGRVHSLESCGTVDGPGVRFVVFLQGCLFRCIYCHNPDSWEINGGKPMTADEVMAEVLKVKRYIRGVTVTGGEPSLQPEFVGELFQKCRQHGIHTALDTNGGIFNDNVREMLEYADLVLLDLKGLDDQLHRKMTGHPAGVFTEMAHWLEAHQKPWWVRYVLVPGYTDSTKDLCRSGEFLEYMEYLERVDVLPFHQMADYKWKELGKDYPLSDCPEPSPEEAEYARELLRSYGLVVY